MQFIDHVALLVSDLAKSRQWYEKVLHLEAQHFPKWQDKPIMMKKGLSAIALFQISPDRTISPHSFHFAFRVDQDEYEAYLLHFQSLNIDFYEEDHHYFQSLYLTDPDGYKVELTTPTNHDLPQE